ncbi:MAG: hypothetical protein LBE37_02440, partial [Sphingobacterium sp.]|nr:hypothetical protein [Sphingobacterium sp.]
DSKSLFKIKLATGVSLSEIKHRIEIKEPICTGVLFYNDHSVLSVLLKNTINILEDDSLPYLIYELEESSDHLDENYLINKEILWRILDSQQENG